MSIFQIGSAIDPNATLNRWQPGSNPPWTFLTKYCKGDFEKLRVRGVKFNESEPVKYPWGLVASFSDPDGNNFSLLQRPVE